MKYFAIFDKNFEAIFQLQWKIENISDMFLQYSVLCGISPYLSDETRCQTFSALCLDQPLRDHLYDYIRKLHYIC